jgi:hypothetical protein
MAEREREGLRTMCQGSVNSSSECRGDESGVQQRGESGRFAGREYPTTPFVVQFERRLFLLTWELTCWTLAELEFDNKSCTFVEQRRSSYEWPREAFGVLLSRFALMERVEQSLLHRTSDDFTHWLSSQFQSYAKP